MAGEELGGGERGQVALIVGAGPGVGSALARRFARAGMNVALAARSTDRFARLIADCTAEGVTVHGYGCDATRERSVVELFAAVRRDIGVPNLVVYNVERFGPGTVVEIEVAEFEDCWRAM